MKDLIIDKSTTLCLPDLDNDIFIEMWDGCGGLNTAIVSFEELEAWVASIRKQIITVATSQKPVCHYCEIFEKLIQIHSARSVVRLWIGKLRTLERPYERNRRT